MTSPPSSESSPTPEPSSSSDMVGGGRVIGRCSRAAATSAVKAHVAVLEGKPLRAAIGEELRAAEKLGGKERRFVAWAVRELSRHLRRIDLSLRARGWPPSKLQLVQDQAIFRYAIWRLELTGASPERVMVELRLPGPTRPRSLPDAVLEKELARTVPLDFGGTELEQWAAKHSFPAWLAEGIAKVAPPGEIEAVMQALNREPFMTFRARPSESRDALVEELRAAGYPVVACPEAPAALRMDDEGRAIFESRWMKQGRLQVMDLGSQLLGELCRAQPGQVVVDYCAGAGGKTILLADAVGPKGRVYAFDNSPRRLKEAKERIGQLGLRHVSFPAEPRLDLADVVLVDAPCSGTGTLAREPDQKWKLNTKAVAELVGKQREILDGLANRLKPGALLVYGTCSVLAEENEAQVEAFLARHPKYRLEESLRVWPHRLDGGGFFGARLRRGVD